MIVRALYGQNQQEQLLEATLPDAWNPLDISFVRLTWIYILNQKSGQKMKESTTFIYVDDILCIHHNADSVLKWLHKSFLLKL